MPLTADCLTEARALIEQDRIESLRNVKSAFIARCPLVPGVDPKIESYRGVPGRVEWFVTVEGASVRDWQITGPNRASPLAAVEAWNRAWVKS